MVEEKTLAALGVVVKCSFCDATEPCGDVSKGQSFVPETWATWPGFGHIFCCPTCAIQPRSREHLLAIELEAVKRDLATMNRAYDELNVRFHEVVAKSGLSALVLATKGRTS